MTRKLILLGSSGLLGSAILRLAEKDNVPILAVSRGSFKGLERQLQSPLELLRVLGVAKEDFIVNAIGITKQRIDFSSNESRDKARWLNSQFPHELTRAADHLGARTLQVGTDCVFSGQVGNYTEEDKKTAHDFYGSTKAFGEEAKNLTVVRTSFVGDFSGSNAGLWDWVKKQPPNAEIVGYTNHFWNGCTTDALAKVLVAIFETRFPAFGVQHLVPKDSVSKHDLVALIIKRLRRSDIRLVPGSADHDKDMRLATKFPQRNQTLWALAGFECPPTIAQMVEHHEAQINT